ncbi:acyl-CoA dehydrogenase [Nocardioides marmoriginsengisoli]|uniref:Acyl-CoA dehydrogenase n=1 Tax=Nocardioides marmoriginsengisoli TaxID=661483 RepID=A0A3N0CG33_9ACTN|nr:acyl-CoA dehydrogenase family protein [Nocardioides marmoriginsengisoli]RNL62432.1 acyl-CoA dehydrogenase [Nocardioides marmoriginsengisoli]
MALSEETTSILRGLEGFLTAEVFPLHEEYAEVLNNPRERYSADGRHVPQVEELRRRVRTASAEAGYFTMTVPSDLGGGGLGAVPTYAAWELIYRLSGPHRWLAHEILAHWATGPSFVFGLVGDEVRDRVLPQLMSGEKTMCFMMSEPDAGSDAWAMRTRAVADGDGWRITGTKQWTTNGPYADFGMVFAVTDAEALEQRRGGLSAFLVDTDAPGFKVDSVIGLYGETGGNHSIISLDQVAVSRRELVGAEGAAAGIGLGGINLGRMYNSAKSVGLSRWALDQALDYAAERRSFGKKLTEHQGVMFPLAACATDVHAAHVLGLDTAARIDAGDPAIMEAAMSKIFSTEMATRTIDRAMQTLGGMGITTEVGMSEAWNMVRTVQIADGSSEILRRLVANRLVGGDRDL